MQQKSITLQDAMQRGYKHIVCADTFEFDVRRIKKTGHIVISRLMKNGVLVSEYETKYTASDVEKYIKKHGGIDLDATKEAVDRMRYSGSNVPANHMGYSQEQWSESEQDIDHNSDEQTEKISADEDLTDNLEYEDILEEEGLEEPDISEEDMIYDDEKELPEYEDDQEYEAEPDDVFDDSEDDMDSLDTQDEISLTPNDNLPEAFTDKPEAPNADQHTNNDQRKSDTYTESVMPKEENFQSPQNESSAKDIAEEGMRPIKESVKPSYDTAEQQKKEENRSIAEKSTEKEETAPQKPQHFKGGYRTMGNKHFDFHQLVEHLQEIQAGRVFKCAHCGREMEKHPDGSYQCKNCGNGSLNTSEMQNYTVTDYLDENAEAAEYVIDDSLKFRCGKVYLLHGNGTELFINTETRTIEASTMGITIQDNIAKELTDKANHWLEIRYEATRQAAS